MLAIGVADENIVREKLSGVKSRRLFNDLLNRLKPGDVLAVWKVDRLGRNAVKFFGPVRSLSAEVSP
jgi:DNA invertase Pin-like site-specific DNA recombinase